MAIDYLSNFPIPAAVLPERLRALLEPVGNSSRQIVEVTSRCDFDPHGLQREYVHMVMAVIPDDEPEVTPLLDEASNGVVAFSEPIDEKGNEVDPGNRTKR